MDIEGDGKKDNPKQSKKDLLRFEKPIFDVYNKDKYANEKEFMLKRLIEEKKKT